MKQTTVATNEIEQKDGGELFIILYFVIHLRLESACIVQQGLSAVIAFH